MRTDFTYLFLSGLLVIGLTACGGGSGGEKNNNSSRSNSSGSSVNSSAAISSSSASVYSANVDNLYDLASFPIGAAVTNNDGPNFNILTNASEKAVVEKHFNQMTAGNIMKMSYLHPNNNTGTISDFTFTNADAFVDYANTKNMSVHGHALIWHSDYQVPAFMKNWSGTPEDFITEIENHVTTIVNHFETKGNLVSWDVVNEALTDDTPSGFRSTYVNQQGETVIDSPFYINSGNNAIYIEKAFLAARAANETVDLYYNDYNIEQNNSKTDKMIEMVKDFKNRSIPISGIGFQMHVCLRYPDAETIATAIKKVVDEGLKVKITELDVAVNQPYCDNYPANKINSFTTDIAFEQKQRYCEIIKAYLDTVPANLRGGITVWGTTDANTWLDGLYSDDFNNQKISWPLLFDTNYNDKPALRGFADGLLGTSCTNL